MSYNWISANTPQGRERRCSAKQADGSARPMRLSVTTAGAVALQTGKPKIW